MDEGRDGGEVKPELSTVKHSCGGNQEASLVQKHQRYKEHNGEEYKKKSGES